MTIYTRTGDTGSTSIYGGRRVLKSNQLIFVIGNIDELNSHIGLVRSSEKNKSNVDFLASIQSDLYQIMAYLSNSKVPIVFIDQKVKLFEQRIDKTMSKLPKISKFIVPGDNQISSYYHLLRTVCRRVERVIVKYLKNNKKDYIIIQYFNRLSDVFFSLAYHYSLKK